MNNEPFFEEQDRRVLTMEAFEFVLANEIKRAVRSQNFLTLLYIAARPAEPAPPADDDRIVQDVAKVVGREVRETDLLARTAARALSVVLLDADVNGSQCAIDRLSARLDLYRFSRPVAIEIGAATCPTDAVDTESLRREAAARRIERPPGQTGRALPEA